MSRNYKRKDHFYQRAKEEGYRSRAAYKLLELDRRFRVFKPSSVVVDLGCFPGGWLQVASQKIRRGKIVGIDLRPLEPLPASQAEIDILLGDITEVEMAEKLLNVSGGRVDVVLSDLSPKLSGIKLRDSVRSAELVETAFNFAESVLKPGGSFIAKIFPGEECEHLAKKIRGNFKKFSRPVLDSSRNSSKEMYFVGIGYKGSLTREA